MTEFQTGSLAETEQLAARLAAGLRRGDLVTVAGELGSGKTAFVRGACAALGVSEAVRARPCLGHLYRRPGPGRHLDLYRLVAGDREGWGIWSDTSMARLPSWSGPSTAPWLPPPRVAVVMSHLDSTAA